MKAPQAEPASIMRRTHVLMVEAQLLRSSLGVTRASLRRVLLRMPRALRGASEPVLDNGDLRDRVRAALARRALPLVDGTAWAGPGTEQICSVCALRIQPSDVEYEVAHGDRPLYAHLSCYTIWCDESIARQSGDGLSSPGR